MAANGDVFRTHVGILKGVREYMDGQRSLWHARGAAVQGAVAKATEVEGTDL